MGIKYMCRNSLGYITIHFAKQQTGLLQPHTHIHTEIINTNIELTLYQP